MHFDDDYYISKIPICRISFITPPDRCAAIVEQAKALYSEFSGASDSQRILELIGARMSAAAEDGDVVHDLLAYLAERIIEMNRAQSKPDKIALKSKINSESRNTGTLSASFSRNAIIQPAPLACFLLAHSAGGREDRDI